MYLRLWHRLKYEQLIKILININNNKHTSCIKPRSFTLLYKVNKSNVFRPIRGAFFNGKSLSSQYLMILSMNSLRPGSSCGSYSAWSFCEAERAAGYIKQYNKKRLVNNKNPCLSSAKTSMLLRARKDFRKIHKK